MWTIPSGCSARARRRGPTPSGRTPRRWWPRGSRACCGRPSPRPAARGPIPEGPAARPAATTGGGSMIGRAGANPMIKSQLKRLSPTWKNRLRRLSRLRWLEKTRIVRAYGVSFREHPLRMAGYVLLDPDVGDFTYELDNQGELVEFLADALALDPAIIAGHLAEIRSEPALTRELTARVRWRPDMKRRVGLAHRVAWYAVVRAKKPRLVVETGIKHGLGSLVLLVALERNAR